MVKDLDRVWFLSLLPGLTCGNIMKLGRERDMSGLK